MAHTIVIFGASGDLTSRKLIPALYELYRKKRLPEQTRIVGFSRTKFSHEAWRDKLAESTASFLGTKFDAALWQEFAPAIHYHAGDIDNAADFASLREFLTTLEGEPSAGQDANPGQVASLSDSDRPARIYYLSTAPSHYAAAIAQLGAAGLAKEDRGTRRVVVEKPFGTDLATARQLNQQLHEVFEEQQIYRIDHYLGKETVQNILVLRFANAIFEPIWNRNYIDHIQITAAEDLTVGHRAAYYDSVGILRDMFQNHLLQLMTFTAMEAPSHFEANAIRDEKVKVLRSIRVMRPEEVYNDTIRGQYRRYRDEPGVPADSDTATFGVVKLHIENWRWQGVPFLLRSGKAMSCRTTQIVIQFRQAPHMLFEGGPRAAFQSNRLVIQVQPAEGIQLHFETKVPDQGMKLRMTDLNFSFRGSFAVDMPEAYERLLLDVMLGDASLFSRSDEVELAWSIVDPIQRGWEHPGWPPLALYESGGWGPPNSVAWMCHQNREWFDCCPVLKHGD
jgi:glucose-6-phosphate 1-dehydrogenase